MTIRERMEAWSLCIFCKTTREEHSPGGNCPTDEGEWAQSAFTTVGHFEVLERAHDEWIDKGTPK